MTGKVTAIMGFIKKNGKPTMTVRHFHPSPIDYSKIDEYLEQYSNMSLATVKKILTGLFLAGLKEPSVDVTYPFSSALVITRYHLTNGNILETSMYRPGKNGPISRSQRCIVFDQISISRQLGTMVVDYQEVFDNSVDATVDIIKNLMENSKPDKPNRSRVRKKPEVDQTIGEVEKPKRTRKKQEKE